ncbi:DTW domain-containing protein 1 [Balamuthia mandrillaris]
MEAPSSSSNKETNEKNRGKKRDRESFSEEAEKAKETEESGIGGESAVLASSSSAEEGAPAHPLHDLKLSDQSFLAEKQRYHCPRCNSKRRFFCYDCHIVLAHPERTPRVSLPFTCDILHHPAEQKSKSTAVHACVLAPDKVKMYEYPEFPDFSEEGTFLLFPSPEAKSIQELDISQMKRLIVIDSTWQKAKVILRDERVKRLPCIQIESHKTLFWRFQQVGDTCLATIEAIYYFYREWHEKQRGEYNGEYDDLLFYYTYMYKMIQQSYKEENKSFKRIKNYIQEQ